MKKTMESKLAKVMAKGMVKFAQRRLWRKAQRQELMMTTMGTYLDGDFRSLTLRMYSVIELLLPFAELILNSACA